MTEPAEPQESLEEVLASLSDVMFPADMGEAPVRIDSRAADGDTPLHKLIWQRNTQGVEILIEAGADVNAIGDMGETPLHVAVGNENEDIIRLLLAAGADTGIVFKFGHTPLSKAANFYPDVLHCFFRP